MLVRGQDRPKWEEGNGVFCVFTSAKYYCVDALDGSGAMVNKVILIGNLGHDAELRHTENNQSVANFNIATSEGWTDKAGEKQERTEWHKIVLWGKGARALAQYLVKGKKVYVEGSLQTRKWEDKSGTNRLTTEIKAQQVRLLGGGGLGEAPAKGQDLTNDDIPF